MAELKPVMGEVKFSGQPPRVRVGLKFMKNLGNFENVTIDIALEEDAEPGETLQEAEARLWAQANQALGARLKEILADRERQKRHQ